MPSTIRWSGVAAPSYARSRASVIASIGLTTKRMVWSPVAWRRSSVMTGFSGSEVANGQHAALDAQRTHPVLAEVFRREVLHDGHGRRQLVPGQIDEAVLERHDPQDVVGGDGAHGDECFAEELDRGMDAGQGQVQDVGGDESFLDEQFAEEPRGGLGGHHAMLPRMLAYLTLAAVAAAGDLAGAVLVTATHRRGSTRLRYFVAAGAGFMLAAAFVRMLPEATHVEHAYLFVLLGYFGVHLFEHTVAPHFHFGEEVHHEALLRPSAGYLAVLGLGVHTLFDGVAIAAGFMVAPSLGDPALLRGAGPQAPRGFTVASLMLASGHSQGARAPRGGAPRSPDHSRGPRHRVRAQHHVAYALALSAGVTLYVAASDLIPEVNREGGPKLGLDVFAGLVLFVAVDWLLSGFVAH
jgi:ZIP family zinc transporter/zinc and cadmium transporter